MKLTVSDSQYAHIALVDTAYFQSRGQRSKAELIVEEWSATYDGDDMGPLDRVPASKWVEAFEQVGFFHGLMTVFEEFPFMYSERLTAKLTQPPLTIPTLTRISTPENRHKWSWTDSLEDLPLLRSTLAANPGEEIWICDKPARVFGLLTRTVQEIGAPLRTAIEYIIDPGDNVRPFEMNAHDDD